MHQVCLRIVQRKEGSGQIFAILSHLEFGILQRIGQEIHWLVRRDWKLLLRRHFWIPRFDLGSTAVTVTAGVFELTKGR